jgi:lysozyme family protein
VSDDFPAALAFSLRWEGGLSNDPQDHGGLTNYGITQVSYTSYRQRHGLPPQSVTHITKAERDAIYRHDYWDAVKGDALAWPCSLVTFDAAVNSGPGRAARWLQAAAGVLVDGTIGPVTAAACAADPQTVALKAIVEREAFLRAIGKGSQKRFLRGWLRRTADLRKMVLA